MVLCRVTGCRHSTAKNERLVGHRLLLVRPIALDGSTSAKAEEVALDPGLDAGVGDAVLIAKEGAVVADLFDAGQPPGTAPTPANVVIVAIVDGWTGG